MAEKQHLVEAIKNLDFNLLHKLLDDDRSYMNVTKSLFLETLEKNIRNYPKLTAYEEVIEGSCGNCFKGFNGYKFRAKNCPSLSLLFYEENGEVIDLFLCDNFVTCQDYEDEYVISFSFFDDQEVDFQPTLEHMINVQNVDKAMEEFYSLADKHDLNLKDIILWIRRHIDLIRKLKLDNFFIRNKYLAFTELRRTYFKISRIEEIYEKNELAKQALADFEKIDKSDEKSVVKWLLQNQDFSTYFLEETEGWKNTGFRVLSMEIDLVVDCSDCIENFLLIDLHNTLEFELMEKYQPSDEYYEKHKRGIECTVEAHLRLHNKYLDLFE